MAFFNGMNLFWVRLIKELYGDLGGFFRDTRAVAGASPWAQILAAEHKLHVAGVVPESTLKRRVGNGVQTRFWEDCWIGNRPLGLVFPRLAALDVDRRWMVADRWVNGRWSW